MSEHSNSTNTPRWQLILCTYLSYKDVLTLRNWLDFGQIQSQNLHNFDTFFDLTESKRINNWSARKLRQPLFTSSNFWVLFNILSKLPRNSAWVWIWMFEIKMLKIIVGQSQDRSWQSKVILTVKDQPDFDCLDLIGPYCKPGPLTHCSNGSWKDKTNTRICPNDREEGKTCMLGHSSLFLLFF